MDEGIGSVAHLTGQSDSPEHHEPSHGRVGLVVYGCGTQGRAILEILGESERWSALDLTDDDNSLWGLRIFGWQVKPPSEVLAGVSRRFLCTIGDNAVRRSVSERLHRMGHVAEMLRHPDAIVAKSAVLGAGSMVMARAVVNTEARVGAGCLLNTGCVVEHHCELQDFVHLAPGVLLGGSVRVGENAFLGLGAVVLPNLEIGHGAVVGAGAVVIRDVPPGAVVAGNPARILQTTR